MVEEVLGVVLAEVGGVDLFLVANLDHLFVGMVGEGSGAGGAGAIGAGDSGEPATRVLVAGGDAVVGHEFEVVGMSADGEVGGAGEGGFGVGAVGDVG